MSKKVSSGHFVPNTARCSFLHWGSDVRQFLEERMSSSKLGTFARTSVRTLLNASKTPDETVPILRRPEKSNLILTVKKKYFLEVQSLNTEQFRIICKKNQLQANKKILTYWIKEMLYLVMLGLTRFRKSAVMEGTIVSPSSQAENARNLENSLDS